MAITYVSAGTAQNTAAYATSVTPGIPASTATSDVLLLVAANFSSGNLVLSANGSGWTSLFPQAGNSTYGTLAAWYTKVTASLAAMPTVSSSLASGKFTARVFAFRGVHTGTAINISGSRTDQAVNTNGWNGTNLTTTSASSMVVMIGSSKDDNTWTTKTGSVNAIVYTANAASTNDNSIFMAYDTGSTGRSAGAMGIPAVSQSTLGADVGQWFTFAWNQAVAAVDASTSIAAVQGMSVAAAVSATATIPSVSVAQGPWGAPQSSVASNYADVTSSAVGLMLAQITNDGASANMAVTSVSGGGMAWTKAGGGASAGDTTVCGEYWWAVATSSLTARITAVTSNPGNFAFAVIRLSGANLSSPVGATSTLTTMGTGPSFTWPFTGLTSGSMLFGLAFPGTYTGPSSYLGGTTLIESQNGVPVFVRSTNHITSSDFTLGYTMGGNNTSAQGVLYGIEIRASGTSEGGTTGSTGVSAVQGAGSLGGLTATGVRTATTSIPSVQGAGTAVSVAASAGTSATTSGPAVQGTGGAAAIAASGVRTATASIAAIQGTGVAWALAATGIRNAATGISALQGLGTATALGASAGTSVSVGLGALQGTGTALAIGASGQATTALEGVTGASTTAPVQAVGTSAVSVAIGLTGVQGRGTAAALAGSGNSAVALSSVQGYASAALVAASVTSGHPPMSVHGWAVNLEKRGQATVESPQAAGIPIYRGRTQASSIPTVGEVASQTPRTGGSIS